MKKENITHGLCVSSRIFDTMKREYPSKILLAWSEAIGGNVELREWLIANEYPELGLFVYALNLKQDARDWLMDNGFPHLMALIRGAEGDVNALLWLRKFEYDVLEKVARSADNDELATNWLLMNQQPEMARVSLKIRAVKNDIEFNNNDMHRISPE